MALMLIQLGTVTVSTAGTAVALKTGDEISATSIMLQADSNNTGNIYYGDSAVDSTGLFLGPGESVPIGGTSIRGITEGLFLNDIYIDSDADGNAVRVGYYKRRN